MNDENLYLKKTILCFKNYLFILLKFRIGNLSRKDIIQKTNKNLWNYKLMSRYLSQFISFILYSTITILEIE